MLQLSLQIYGKPPRTNGQAITTREGLRGITYIANGVLERTDTLAGTMAWSDTARGI